MRLTASAGFVKQYHVLVRPDALLKYDITLRDVVEAIEKNNANAAGGYIVHGWEQTYIRGLGLLTSAEDIGRIVLKAQNGSPVYVQDVADVVIGPQSRQGAVTRDGKGEAVAGMVIMLRGENSKEVVSRVKEAIPKIQKSLPKGARINVFYDRTSLIEACIETVTECSPGRWGFCGSGTFYLPGRTANSSHRGCLAANHLPCDISYHGVVGTHMQI